MAGYTGAAGTNDGNWKGSGNTGLTTGTTIRGNTAYGPAGGMAQGYATRDQQSLAKAGMGPTMGTYSNFMDANGNPMFAGALGGQGFQGMNAQQAQHNAMAAYLGMGLGQAPQPASRPTYPGPVPQRPPVRPVSLPQAFNLDKSMMPGFFGGTPATSYPSAPAYNNFGPRPYDGGYTSTVKMNSPANNPQYGYVGGNSLGNYPKGSGQIRTVSPVGSAPDPYY